MTSIKDFRNAIKREMERYAKVTSDRVEDASKEIAKETAKDVKKYSPVDKRMVDRRGQYKKGWRIYKDRKDGYIVYNKTDYRLTHLLEKGHKTRDGSSKTDPQPHIKPAEVIAIREFEKRIEEIARGGK